MAEEIQNLSPFMKELKPYLEREGYTLKRQISNPDSYSGSNSIAWLVEREEEDSVLKITSYDPRNSRTQDNLDKAREFVERERTVAGQLGSHPSIPGLRRSFDIDYGVDTAYCTELDLIRAPSLAEIIASGKRISENEAGMLAKDDIDALGLFHSKGGMHRDVRPENVYLNGERAYISDFGIVTLDEKDRGTFMMYAPYYPLDFFMEQRPEQDLVALGNVIISAGLGKTIDQVRNEQEIDAHQRMDVSRLPYSENLRGFLDKLTQEPGQRYRDAKSALHDLEKIIKGNLPPELGSTQSTNLTTTEAGARDVSKYEGRCFYEVADEIMKISPLSEEERISQKILEIEKKGLEMITGEDVRGLNKTKETEERQEKYAALREAAEHYGIDPSMKIEDAVRGMVKRKDQRSLIRLLGESNELWRSLGGLNANSEFASEGAGIGVITSLGAAGFSLATLHDPFYFLASTFITVPIGVWAGKNISQHRNANKLYSRARELGTWLTEAGYFPRENTKETSTAVVPAGGLEGKVELSMKEESDILSKVMDEGVKITSVSTIIGMIGGGLIGHPSYEGASVGASLGITAGGVLGAITSVVRYNSLTKKALNEKRRELGLPEEKGLVGKLIDRGRRAVEWVDDHSLKRGWKGEVEFEYSGGYGNFLSSMDQMGLTDNFFPLSGFKDNETVARYSFLEGISIKAKTQKRAEEIKEQILSSQKEQLPHPKSLLEEINDEGQLSDDRGIK